MIKPKFREVFKKRWRQFLSINGIFYGWLSLYDYYCSTWQIQLMVDEDEN